MSGYKKTGRCLLGKCPVLEEVNGLLQQVFDAVAFFQQFFQGEVHALA